MTTRRNGFTLLEVVLALILAGLLVMLMSAYLSRSVVSPDTPLVRVQRTATLSNAMEAVARDYGQGATHSAADLAALASRVGAFQANYGAYCSTCTGATSTLTLGPLDNALLVTIADGNGQSISRVFTVLDY